MFRRVANADSLGKTREIVAFIIKVVYKPRSELKRTNMQASDRSLEVWKAPRKIKQLKETLYEKVVKSSLFHEILYA